MLRRIIFIFTLVVLSGFATQASAATLKLMVSPKTASVGETMRVDVLVSTPNTALNLVAGTINFPSDKLQLVSLSKTGTIINFWTAEPSFSNNDGKVFFEGGVLNPGFTGNNGKVLSAYFKVLKQGSAPLTFSSPIILANDGKGSSIFDTAYNNQATLIPRDETIKVKPATSSPAVETNEPSFEFIVATSTVEEEPAVEVSPVQTVQPQQEQAVPYGIYAALKAFMSSEFVADISVGIVAVSLITMFLMLLFFACGKIHRMFAKKPIEQLKNMDTLVSRIFIRFEKDITQHLSDIREVSKRRPLTEEEQKFVFQFSQLLRESEADIRNSMKDIL